MKRPIFVRPLTDAERVTVQAGVHSPHRFVVRRAQMLLASADQTPVPDIARVLCCNRQTVRNAIHAFNQTGLAALTAGSCRPHRTHAAFPDTQAAALHDLLHRTPRDYGHPTSLWTLQLAATVSFAQGLTPTRVSAETIRATLARLGVRWRRAKQWISSPDPDYARKKVPATV